MLLKSINIKEHMKLIVARCIIYAGHVTNCEVWCMLYHQI